MKKELPVRSIAKSVSWRITASLITIILVFLFTKRFELALAIGGIEVILKMIVYYLHERVWNKVKWGISYE